MPLGVPLLGELLSPALGRLQRVSQLVSLLRPFLGPHLVPRFTVPEGRSILSLFLDQVLGPALGHLQRLSQLVALLRPFLGPRIVPRLTVLGGRSTLSLFLDQVLGPALGRLQRLRQLVSLLPIAWPSSCAPPDCPAGPFQPVSVLG